MSRPRPQDDIPFIFTDVVEPTSMKFPYAKTTYDDFVAMLQKHDPEGLVWMYTIGVDRVIRRPPEAIARIDQAYEIVVRELLNKYGLSHVCVREVYNVGEVSFNAVYWNAQEAEENIGTRCPTLALNMYIMRYVPVRSAHDTIMHEIAHALTQGYDHNEVWRHVALALGSTASLQSGGIDSRFIAENRYDAAIVFQCKEGCFECYGKYTDHGDVIGDIMDDCNERGELENPSARCEKHHLPIHLFPPRGMTTAEYINDLLKQHELFNST